MAKTPAKKPPAKKPKGNKSDKKPTAKKTAADIPKDSWDEPAADANANGKPITEAFLNPEAVDALELAAKECETCNGLGLIEVGKGKKKTKQQCEACGGSGWKPEHNPDLKRAAEIHKPRDAEQLPPVEPAGPLAGTINEALADIAQRAIDAINEPLPDYKAPDHLARYDAQTVQQLNDLQEQAAEQEQSFNDSHAETSRRKKAWEKTLEAITETIKERRENRGRPVQPKLFPDPEEAPTGPPVDRQAKEGRTRTPDTDTAPNDWTPGDTGPEADTPIIVDDSWMMVPIEDLRDKDGLTPAIFKLLKKEEFETLGQVMLTLKDEGGVKNIKGFKKHVGDWDDCLIRFWTRWEKEAPSRNAVPANGSPDNEVSGGEPGGAPSGENADGSTGAVGASAAAGEHSE